MSTQRRSGRKRAANSRITDLPDSSPTQRPQPTAKRRKANPASRSRGGRRPKTANQDDEQGLENRLFNNETEDEEEDQELTLEEENRELTKMAVQYLDVAPYEVAVAKTYDSNLWDEYGEDVEAFAKLSGSKWTYLVQQMNIVIGRYSEDPREGVPERVDIDLGPNKMTSRQHAEIFFDQGTEDWYISVHGRNGVRVNERQVRRNTSHRIDSGDIIAIAGTQMLFQLPGKSMNIAPFFFEKMRQAQEQNGNKMSLTLRRHNLYANEHSRNETEAADGSVAPPTPPYAAPQAPQARPKTPEPSPKQETANSVKKRSPYKRGMMMESSEQIDYSLDSSKDIKPACSYASMITWAILSSPDECLSLHGIYEWIKEHYAFYRLVPSGWQNSIRHNLSLNTNFHKVPRRPDEPGKGMKWTFVPESREATIAAAKKNASRGGGRVSSAPGSPAGAPVQGGFALPATNGDTKRSPTQRTPPLSSYPPAQQEASTPSNSSYHQPPMPVYGPTQGQLPVLSDQTSPLPRRYADVRLPINGSSPTLTSGAFGSMDLPMHTPAPRVYNLTVPQPNTAKLPTSHMTPTTPAPFWKLPMANGLGSTPARWPDSSPAKNDGGLAPMSSSPPPVVGNGPESPTRKGGSSHQQRVSNSFETSGQNDDVSANSRSTPQLQDSKAVSPPAEEQEGGIDLLKGFTKISTFHQPQRNSWPSAQAH